MTPQLWVAIGFALLIVMTLIYSLLRVAAPTDEQRRIEEIERYLAFRNIFYALIPPEESESGLWEAGARGEYGVRYGVGETKLEALQNLMRVLLLAEVRA